MKRLFPILIAVLIVPLSLAGPGHEFRGFPHGEGHGPGFMDGLHDSLFPPDLVLMNQTSLGLTDEQVLAITKAIGSTHDKVAASETALRAAAEQLHGILDKPQVDETAALATASQVMDLEKQIKTAHIGLLIRVKNV